MRGLLSGADGEVEGPQSILVAVLAVKSNYMALCFMECSWNTEQGDPLGLLIRLSVCRCVFVFACGTELHASH